MEINLQLNFILKIFLFNGMGVKTFKKVGCVEEGKGGGVVSYFF